MQFTLLLTIALVVMVMFLFLRKFWTTVITSVALPLSLIGTFGIMYLVGFSLDNLSLMALTISTGFVVDDAIVMIENIVRFIEAGDTPLEAALKGAKQIGFTVVSLSVSLSGGVYSAFVHDRDRGTFVPRVCHHLERGSRRLGVRVADAHAMMCAKLLRSEAEDEQEHQGEFYRRTEEYWTRFRNWYERGLRWVLAASAIHPQRCDCNIGGDDSALYARAERTAAATGHRRDHWCNGCAENISFRAMVQRVHAVSDIVRKDPDVASVSASVGAGTVNATVNTARLYIELKPHDQRVNAEKIIERLRECHQQCRRRFALYAGSAGSADRKHG